MLVLDGATALVPGGPLGMLFSVGFVQPPFADTAQRPGTTLPSLALPRVLVHRGCSGSPGPPTLGLLKRVQTRKRLFLVSVSFVVPSPHCTK